MELTDLQRPKKRATSSVVTIEQLPSPMLTKIFSYLPFKDRYLLVIVSSKWAEVSRVPWTDITFLNLASIPRAMTDPILRLCPKLGTIEARDQTIVLEKNPHHPVCDNVHTMKLHEVRFAGKDLSPLIPSFALVKEYFERFPRLAELILYDCKATYALPPLSYTVESAINDTAAAIASAVLTIVVIERIPASLERLILTRPHFRGAYVGGKLQGSQAVQSLPQLRELCLVDVGCGPDWLAEANGKGETLSRDHRRHDQFEEHGLGHLNEVQFPVILPPRQSFPDCAEEGLHPPVSPLQIFVGGDFTKHVRFTLPKTEVANFWRIDSPMPEYLAKPEVAAVFKGDWVAKVLREGPETGLLPWGHPDQTELFFSTEPLSFC